MGRDGTGFYIHLLGSGGLALIFGAGEMLTPTTVLAWDGTLSQGVYGTGRDRVLHSSVG